MKFRPHNVDLGDSKSITWTHYPASARKKIFDYVSSNPIFSSELMDFFLDVYKIPLPLPLPRQVRRGLLGG